MVRTGQQHPQWTTSPPATITHFFCGCECWASWASTRREPTSRADIVWGFFRELVLVPIMARLRRKRHRYGLTSGILAFAAGWAAITLILPNSALSAFPRWKTSLWVYLGTHFVRLSDVFFGGVGLNTVQPVDVVGLQSNVFAIPVAAAGLAGLYTCYEINSTRIKHNIENAMTAGTGYFLCGLAAMILADVRPEVSMILIIALVVGGGIWLGSTVLGFLTGGLPFIGIASLGSIAAIGILMLMGGIAILSAILGLVAISFIAPGLAGALVGISRQLERRGRRHDSRFSRSHGLYSFAHEYWKVIVATGLIAVALFVGLTGGM